MTDHLRAADAARVFTEDDSMPNSAVPTPQLRSAGELRMQFPSLRKAIINGLLREGETLNIIAPAKNHKSFLALDLAVSLATGSPFLGAFNIPKHGQVLYIDNELHPETSSDRLPKIVDARNIGMVAIDDVVFVDNLRGRLVDIHRMVSYFDALTPGRFTAIILDALYRFLPDGVSENDNAAMAQVYNAIDQYAARLRCAFVLIHHASKGSQSNKSVADVGAGAGSQARAADSHLILRPHQEPSAVVMEAVVRSWAPLTPLCLRWQYPVWTVDSTLNPTDLKKEPPRSRAAKPNGPERAAPPDEPAPMTAEDFVASFVTAEPQIKDVIIEAARVMRSRQRALALFSVAEAKGLIHRWRSGGANTKARYATTPEPKVSARAAKTRRKVPNRRKHRENKP